jgi:hypothetical protein
LEKNIKCHYQKLSEVLITVRFVSLRSLFSTVPERNIHYK